MKRFILVFILPLLVAVQTSCDDCDNSYNTVITLERIEVIDEADGPGNAEPYLWPIFFKIDYETLEPYLPYRSCGEPNPTKVNENKENWLYAPNGSHGNLGSDWGSGDVIPISYSIGEWRVNLVEKPPLITSDDVYVGVLIVLLEEDAFPSSTSIRDIHYPEFKEKVTAAIETEIITKLSENCVNDSSSTATGSDEEINGIDGVVLKVQNELTDALSDHWLTYLIPLLPVAIDIDDFIGVDFQIWSASDLRAGGDRPFVIEWYNSTGSEDGDFRLFGSINYSPIPLCPQ